MAKRRRKKVKQPDRDEARDKERSQEGANAPRTLPAPTIEDTPPFFEVRDEFGMGA
jgi:hypothetical protein